MAIQASYGYTMVLQMIFCIFFHKVKQICPNLMDFKHFYSIFNLNTELIEKLINCLYIYFTFYTENSP